MKLFKSQTCLLLIVFTSNYYSCSQENEPRFEKLYFEKKSESDHFEFYYDDGLLEFQAKEIETVLEANYNSIVDHLEPGPMPKIKIAIWSNKDQFNKDMDNQFIGAAGYVNGKKEVRVLYTGSPGMLQGIVHEFVHMVTLHMNEGFANNPRWLWESVAQYEAGLKVDLKKNQVIVNGEFPSLKTLSTEKGTNQRIYPLGYCISEFIVETWGYDSLRILVKSNGNIKKVLGLEETAFEEQWKAFVTETYLK